MELNKKISHLRKERGMSQQTLAEALNVSRQAISRWEVGTAAPSMENIMALSQLFQVPVNELLGIDDVATTSDPKETSSNKDDQPHEQLDMQQTAQSNELGIYQGGHKQNKHRVINILLVAMLCVTAIIIATMIGSRWGQTHIENTNQEVIDIDDLEPMSIPESEFIIATDEPF